MALDIPTGVDSTTGAVDPLAVRADLTLTFGSMKRGLLIARGVSGEIAVLDIGLGIHSAGDGSAPVLIDASYARAHVPAIRAEWHKGLRRRSRLSVAHRAWRAPRFSRRAPRWQAAWARATLRRRR